MQPFLVCNIKQQIYMEEIRKQVSSIEAAIAMALSKKKDQLRTKEQEFARKLDEIKSRIIEIQEDLGVFENDLPQSKNQIIQLPAVSSEESQKKRGRPLPRQTQTAYMEILKALNQPSVIDSGLTILNIASILGNNEDEQFKKTTRKRIEKLTEEGDIEAVGINPLKERQRNLNYRITEKGKILLLNQ